ncbi:MAG: hypothetical protein ACYCTB_09745 [bacterium]
MDFSKKNYIFKIFIAVLAILLFITSAISFYFLIKGIINYAPNKTQAIQYFGISLSGFVAFGTILLASATFYSLFESKRKDEKIERQSYNQYKTDHLDAIRVNCLNPIKNKLKNIQDSELLEIREQEYISEESLRLKLNILPYNDKNIFEQHISIVYTNYSINDKVCNDIKNHKDVNGIIGDYYNILKLISEKYLIYLESLLELTKNIKKIPEFQELKNRIKKNYEKKDNTLIESIKQKYFNFIIDVSLQDYRNLADLYSEYPNYYNLVDNDKELENVRKISDILKNSKEGKIAKKIKYEIKEKIDRLIKKIDNILYNSYALPDECDILKNRRKELGI